MNSILNEFEPGGPVDCADVVFASIVEEAFQTAFTPAGDPSADNTLYLMKRPVSEMSNAGAQQGRGTGVYGPSGEWLYNRWTNAVIYIRQDVNMGTASAAEVYKVVFRHEVGHTFWLADHYDSPCSVTMMCAGNQGYGITHCDRLVIREIYCPPPPPTPTPESTCASEGEPCIFSCCPGYTCADVDSSSRICVGESPGMCDTGYTWSFAQMQCIPTSSPVLVDVAGDGFALTDAPGGVNFDLDRDGVREKLAWTAVDSDDAWLVLDRNGDGAVGDGAELFGNYTPQPEPPAGQQKNGFLALAEFDKSAQGGNGDGLIDARDAVFSSLRLWRDANHDGVSQPTELHTPAGLGLGSIDLDYKESGRRDRYGNRFRYRAKVRGDALPGNGRWAYDVFLLSGQ
jgi:hypothetical protein